MILELAFCSFFLSLFLTTCVVIIEDVKRCRKKKKKIKKGGVPCGRFAFFW
ncbi:hypothetical protein IGK56_001370 [Enterococcus sp. AZ152]